MMRRLQWSAFAGIFLSLFASADAQAQLDLASLQALQSYVFCEQECDYGSQASYPACLADCGAVGAQWDIDLDGDVDRADYRRALREYWGEPDCAGSDAGSAACLDEDGDGLVKWQEAALGTTDAPGAVHAQTVCTNGTACGFAARCTFSNPSVSDAIPIDVGFCVTREGCADANANTCTAFHLELVEETDQEVVVHVYFDHAPVEARILDLHINVPRRALRLTNARALQPLIDAGKTVEVRASGYQTADMKELRLIILGVDATRPIPRGPIAELVFSRVSATHSGSIAFTTDDTIQRRSMAPNPDSTPGDLSSPLEADHLWGTPVIVGSVAPSTPKLALYYSFDDDSLAPLPRAVPDEETACALLYGCDAKTRVKYNAMQLGVVEAERGIVGVSGPGIFLDGFSDHLELPVVFDDVNLKDDDFSVSFWFYHEGDRRGTGVDEQILFAHHTSSNRTGFGVVLRPTDNETVALEWFEGDRSDTQTVRTQVARGLPDRTWFYFAASLDGDGTGLATASLYLRHPTDPSLSTTTRVEVSDMIKGCLSTRQSKLALVEPLLKRDAIFYASSRNNLFGVARMDPNGMSQTNVLREKDSTALDPDFHPGNGKIVFVSSRTGGYEVWLANVDGSEPVQITSGFGSTATGRFVRHPRWSPDGTAIVFESNTYSSQRYYNTLARSYQLYYLRYNPTNGRITVPQASGDSASVLDFVSIEQLDAFYRYTLTGVDANNESNRYHFTNAHWLGNDRIVVTRANEHFDNAKLVWFDLSNTAASYEGLNRVSLEVDGLPQGLPDGDVRLLAAGKRDGVSRALFAQELSRYESGDASYRIAPAAWAGEELSVTVSYVRDPATFEDDCWDRNFNRVCDATTENPDGQGTCTKLDCQPAELRDLYLWYDEDLEPVVDPITGRLLAAAGDWILANKPVEGDSNGGLEVSSHYSSSGAYLTVQVFSETSALPIPQNTHLATLRFRLKNGRVPEDVEPDAFIAKVRRTHQDLLLSSSDYGTAPLELRGAAFERVNSGAFSPTLERIVLAGVQDARPMVATSDALDFSTVVDDDSRVGAYMHVISSAPMRVEGLSWRSFEAAFNCNWMGSYRRPTTGLYEDSFRGGLDEVRYYDYARSDRAIESEFERGAEWLRVAGRDAQVERRNGVCSTHLDCAAYEQCWDEDGDGVPRCAPRHCTQPSDCGLEGSCRLMPVPVSQARPDEETELQFVCAVECASASQCYEQECLNGPCMFCQAMTCAECQPTTGEFGIEYIEGCPDRNSFACEEGSCLSECYSFENGVSRYLCDSATEYCRQGKCVLLDWDWPDLSPATFSGMGEMLSINHGGTPADPMIYTEATAQFHTVQLEAYGVGDYLGAPEVLVEVHSASMYGRDGWSALGRVLVYNKTRNEAEDTSRRYRLTSPYPFDSVRLRLVIPPYSNLNGAATGLGPRLAAHCEGDARNCVDRERTTPGSRAYLGYRIGFPEQVARPYGPGQDLLYLYGGQPAVVVSKLLVGSISSETELNLTALPSCADSSGQCVINRICKYDGGETDTDPIRTVNGVQLTPAPVKDYGDRPTDFPVATAGFALLNCAWDPVPELGQAKDRSAELVVRQIPNTVFVAGLTGRPDDGKHLETANSCFVTVDVGGSPQFVPCYETLGSDPNLDPYNLDSQIYRTLDIDTFQSFGYEMETMALSEGISRR